MVFARPWPAPPPADPAAMHLVIVNDHAHVRGGADRVALGAAAGFADAGHRVTLFTAVGPVDEALARHPRVTVVCLQQADILRDPQRLRAARQGIWNTAAARAFRRIASAWDGRDTVVHVHSFTKALSAAVPHAATALGLRTVLTLHDYFLGCPNGGFFEYPVMEICRRDPLGLSCLACQCDARSRAHKLWRFARTWVQNRVAELPRRLDCVITLSALNRETARRFLPAGTRLVTVPNPVEVARAEPVRVEQNAAFVFAGRLEPYKGPQLLAEAATLCGGAAVFCGAGPAADRVRALNPAARLTGWLEPAALQAELGRARALVFPSLWPETFGLTALEALARGIPVIASRGTAAEEQVQHDVNGLLFERGSAASLAEMMRRLADPATAARLGREAHARYWQGPFTLARHVAALEGLFGSLEAIRPAA